MGREKSLLEIGSEPVIVQTARLLKTVSASVQVIAPPEEYSSLGLDVIPDLEKHLGPLGGIATALHAAEKAGHSGWCLIVACDLPYLTQNWLKFLTARAHASHADVILPHTDGGPEPLCAAYHSRCNESVTAALQKGIRKVTDGLANLKIEEMSPSEIKPFDSDGRLFKNMNTPEDYEEARAFFERHGGATV
ncbi:MAG: molybdenum cofactor guanylyltransferase [Acidobacteria bacterium]|nr:molybdenum cofactor guanylyltransferase [Acidobacteriota bacterium]